ncbi:LAQU0S12e03488g1_1 [Lachancea quebecensis]|uniref:3-methyl-2-oxobutanoate hydroxymethyltransferase n=1 Tax=Lachancea quebecensis TaxID=1654605 RepID=A0A0P1KX67_9SACH|nr:LAQU0S12e03488g1_1 [Lachancea quebecensis]
MIRSAVHHFRRSYSGYLSPVVRSKTLTDVLSKHASREPISVITAYDYISGSWAQAANCDVILVGDSLAMCALGYESTTEISLEEFRFHVQSVCRSPGEAFIVVDIPFGSFESSIEKGVETAISLMRCSPKVGALKLEVGSHKPGAYNPDYSLKLAAELCSRGIPVMGHIGLTPQRVHSLGGYKVQGNRSAQQAAAIFETARELQKLGCFSLLVECVPHKVSQYITETLNIPTIGIGAGSGTSGQVLVQSDILGMLPGRIPKLAQKYTDLHTQSVDALKHYVSDVTMHKFPENDKNGFKIKEDVWREFLEIVE